MCVVVVVAVGYTIRDVVYEWRFGHQRAVVASPDMALSQFDLTGMPAASSTACFQGSKCVRGQPGELGQCGRGNWVSVVGGIGSCGRGELDRWSGEGRELNQWSGN